MSDQPVTVELVWTPALLREVMSAAQGKASSRGKKIFTSILLLLAAAFIVFTVVDTGQFFILAAPVVFGLLVLLRWWSVARWIKGEMASRLRRGNTRVTLSNSGIDSVHPLSNSHFEWELVLDLRDGPLALHIMLTPVMSLPIPDAALPEGMAREDLRRRIDEWRAGGVFA